MSSIVLGTSAELLQDNDRVSEERMEVLINDNGARELVLCNVLILDEIFSLLSTEDWKSARLVNKTFHSALQLPWRDQMKYKLGFGENVFGVETVATKFLEEQHPAISTDDPLQLSRYPIRHISVTRNINGRPKNRYTLLQLDQPRFWELFGHGLKRLNLDGIRIYRGASLKRLLFELMPNLEEFRYNNCVCEDINNLDLNTVTEYTSPNTQQKNLTCLTLGISNDYGRDGCYPNDCILRFPIGWIELFSMFSNIQKLELEVSPIKSQRPSDFLKLFESIDIIRKANNNQVLNITELVIYHYVDYKDGLAHIDLINNQALFASLPVSILDMNLTSKDYTGVTLLIQTFKSTLRNLSLRLELEMFDRNPLNVYLPCKVLPQGLIKLHLSGELFPTLEFLSFTPNLEELKVEDIPCKLPPGVDIAPLANLKKLAYPFSPDSWDWEPLNYMQMQVLVKLMPNLKDCECAVDAGGFQALCHGWPNSLEQLNVEFEFTIESLFVENLIKLKCLKSLKIGTACGFKVNDQSVFKGFLKMPSLTKIQFPRYMTMISEEGLQALKDKKFVTILS